MTISLPSLNGLRAFEAAARHLSFTRAAAELHVTQTAISHQIRRLEAQLGMRLFTRGRRALSLTQEAQGYLPAVRAAFEDLHAATARLLRPNRDQLLTVSTMASLAAKWLLPRLAGVPRDRLRRWVRPVQPTAGDKPSTVEDRSGHDRLPTLPDDILREEHDPPLVEDLPGYENRPVP